MAYVTWADRVRETTTTTGTGTLTLAGAVSGHRTFVAGVGDAAVVEYTLLDADGLAWEVGEGTVTDAASDTLSRATVIASSNAGSKIDLSAGTHTVFIAPTADRYQSGENMRRHGYFLAAGGSANQTISNDTWTKVTTAFDTQVADLESWWDATTNFRYTPLREGIYLIGFYAYIATTQQQMVPAIYKNGAAHTHLGRFRGATDNDWCQGGVVPVRLNGTTDYVSFYVYQNSAFSKTLQANATRTRAFGWYLGLSA